MKDSSINGSGTQWLRPKHWLKKFLLGLGRVYQERLSFLFSLCLCLSIQYLPTLETGYWARQTFALIQFINLVFSLPLRNPRAMCKE